MLSVLVKVLISSSLSRGVLRLDAICLHQKANSLILSPTFGDIFSRSDFHGLSSKLKRKCSKNASGNSFHELLRDLSKEENHKRVLSVRLLGRKKIKSFSSVPN